MDQVSSLRQESSLSDQVSDIIAGLPKPPGVPDLDWVENVLTRSIDWGRPVWLAGNYVEGHIRRPVYGFPGLNTIGMLLDRVSILLIRTNRVGPSEAVEEQLRDLREVIPNALPGRSSDYNKVTDRVIDRLPRNLSEAVYDLVTANVTMWDAQETIYRREVDDAEMRRYLNLFSKQNLRRNMCIAKVEEFYWV